MTLAGPGWGGGYIAAAPTPFTRGGELDTDRLREVVGHFVREGAAGLSVNGTAGEWFLQSVDERRQVAEVAREIVPRDVPFIVGLSSQSLQETLLLAEHARDLEVAAVLVGLPLGRAWSDEEVATFYQTVTERTGLPVLVYSLRQAHGGFLSTDLVRRLAAVDGVVGVKDDAPDLPRRRELVHGDNGLVVFADVLHPAVLGEVEGRRGSQIGAGMPLGRLLPEALRAPGEPRSLRVAAALAEIKAALVEMYGPGQPWHRDLKGLMFAEGVDAGYPRFPGMSGRDDVAVLERYRQILQRARDGVGDV